jgi:5-methylcytosine-specific restriction endonuclease McrA
MTNIPYGFIKFLFNNTNYSGRTNTKKVIIQAVVNYFNDIPLTTSLKTQKQNVSIVFKKAYKHLLKDKPTSVPVPKYLLFLAGYKRCKCNKVIYKLSVFEKSNTTWDGYKDWTTEGRSQIYFANKATVQEYRQWYQKENASIIANNAATRRAKKLQATPIWLTTEQKEQIKLIYAEANRLTKSTNIAYHVDHIVPLNNDTVCGLHVPWNLQVLKAVDNIVKSNKLIGEVSSHQELMT